MCSNEQEHSDIDQLLSEFLALESVTLTRIEKGLFS